MQQIVTRIAHINQIVETAIELHIWLKLLIMFIVEGIGMLFLIWLFTQKAPLVFVLQFVLTMWTFYYWLVAFFLIAVYRREKG